MLVSKVTGPSGVLCLCVSFVQPRSRPRDQMQALLLLLQSVMIWWAASITAKPVTDEAGCGWCPAGLWAAWV